MKNLLIECINELCIKCGKYESEHMGACDHCKWYEMKTKGYCSGMKKNMSMVDLAEDMKFWCESGEDCEHCPVCYDGHCAVGAPCEWVLKEA